MSKTCHDKIDERHGVERNVPPVHQAKEVGDDHRDGDQDDQRRVQVQSEQDKGDDKDGRSGNAEADEHVAPHGQVLFVEDVKDAVRVDFHLAVVGAERARNVGGDDARLPHGRIEVDGRAQYRVVRHEIVSAHSQTLVDAGINQALCVQREEINN